MFRDRVGSHYGRQRAMFADGHLLLVLHEPPEPDINERLGCFFWRHPDGSWSSSGFGTGPAALAKHINDYADAAER